MVAADIMDKSKVKISVSDSDSSNEDVSDSDNGTMEANDIEDDAVSGSSSDNNTNNALMTNEGWADSVAKILVSSKPKNKKTLVLSRAKKYTDTIKRKVEEKPEFEIIGEVKEEGKTLDEPIKSEPLIKKKKTDKPTIRVKPNILEKDRERLLSKIATKGVVQLFNAVRNQQKTIEKQMERSDITENKKEKFMKKFDKRTFLDTLMGQTKSIVVDEATKKIKDNVKDEDKSKWSVLRDDFMMGAKMKDWDKEVEVE